MPKAPYKLLGLNFGRLRMRGLLTKFPTFHAFFIPSTQKQMKRMVLHLPTIYYRIDIP